MQTAPWVERARKSLFNSFSTGGSCTCVNMLWCDLEEFRVDRLNCFTFAEDSMRSVLSISTMKQTSRWSIDYQYDSRNLALNLSSWRDVRELTEGNRKSLFRFISSFIKIIDRIVPIMPKTPWSTNVTLSNYVSRANPSLSATVRGSKTAFLELPHSSRAIIEGSRGYTS